MAEDDVLARGKARQGCGLSLGFFESGRGRAPYQMAIAVRFEDVEGGNHVFKLTFRAGRALGYGVRVTGHERFGKCARLRAGERVRA